MARLIIITGASGAGKTFVLSQLQNYRDDFIPVRKLTTRPSRPNESQEESVDLKFNCSTDEIRKCQYTYPYCNHYYGFKKRAVNEILQQGKNPIVIVANCKVIVKIKKDYPNALVIYVQSGLSGADLKEQMLKYRDPLDVEERMQRQKKTLNEYVQYLNRKLFDYYMVNYYDDTFLQQVEQILEDETDGTSDSNYIFIIMSFDEKYDNEYKSMKFAAQSVKHRNLIAERVSEPLGDYIITDKIEKSIMKAELIICDVSEISPNVYYELGFARAKGKKIILTARKGTKLPFDIRQYRTNFYNDTVELQTILLNELNSYYK